MRHIAIFLPILNGGGAERMMRHLGSEFTQRNIQCDLLVATDKGPPLETPPEGVTLIRLHKQNCRRAIPALARYLRTERPDVLLSTVFSANIAAVIAAKFLCRHIRLVIREASRTDLQIKSHSVAQRRIDFRLRKILYPRADLIVAVSQDVQADLARANLAGAGGSRVIYNPLTRRIGVRQPLLNSQACPMLLACGRLEAEKDYETLLRATEIVLRQKRVHLTILGDGSLLADLKLLTSHLGIQEHVAFKGFVEDTQPYLEGASVFVHTSRYEGFPSAILEAVAAGCPVVATDSPGGAREILRGGELGALVPVGDARAVAASVLDILNGTATFSIPSDYAARFSLPAVAAQYLEVLFPSA